MKKIINLIAWIKYFIVKIICWFKILFNSSTIKKSDRLKVYIYALALLEDEYARMKYVRGLCFALGRSELELMLVNPSLEKLFIFGESFSYKDMFIQYPEIYIYKPFKHGAFWFDQQTTGYKKRKLILERSIKKLS